MAGRVRWGLCAAALAAAGIAGSAPAAAQSGRSAEPGAYGGGLIEYLMTGSVPARSAAAYADPAARAYPAPARYGAAVPGRPWQPERHAALPQAPIQAPAYPAVQAPVTSPRAEAWARPDAADPMNHDRMNHDPMNHDSMAYAVPRAEPGAERIGRGLDPRFQRQEVAFPGPQRAGTIVVDTPNKYLYLVQPGGRALRYGIGVGRPGFTWAGLKTVSRKAEWPDWIPPKEMLARRPDLPRHMAGGPENPLGARALYLGSSLYRIHGTNEPHTIGQSVSSGCIRMMNADVVDLYARVPVGTRVEVM
jgi:lipoprotein-anchoring transpeptidase ErfK/SrfK